jgi:peptidoglycan/LPS O-acetylase OafA/YrhL
MSSSSPAVSPSVESPPRTRTAARRILELDGLRGVAVLLVITKHYGGPPFQGSQWTFASFTSEYYFSFSGADFFIVLTGFLLGGILLDASSSAYYYRTFFFRRASRTFPLYYLTLLAFIAAALVQTPLGLRGRLRLYWPFGTPWSMLAYACFVQNYLMAYRGRFGPPWLLETWSLAVIEQFYLFLPWVLRRVSYYRMLPRYSC